MKGLDDGELLKRLVKVSEGRPIVLGCALGPQAKGRRNVQKPGAGAAMVQCLAMLKESHLVALVMDYSSRVELDCSGCGGCSFKDAVEIINRTVRHADTLLCALGSPGTIEVRTGPAQEADGRGGMQGRRGDVRVIDAGPELSRRELFAFLANRARTEVVGRFLGEVAPKDDAILPAEGTVPERRGILLEALQGRTFASAALADVDLPVRSLALTGCVVCRSCESFCPTGALSRVERDGETAITFEMARCVGCPRCGELCPEGAISYGAELDLETLASRNVVTLAATPRTLCAGCGKEHHPEIDDNVCPTCNKRARFDGMVTSILFGRGL